jgi:hypothetical protein
MPATFDVIIPGLVQLPVAEPDIDLLQNRLPALNHILRYSRRCSSSNFDFEAMLADSLGMTSPNIPFASAFDDEYSPSQSLLCQAVHMQPDMRNALIFSLDETEKTKEHISIVINDLKDYFKQEFSLLEVDEGLWLIQLSECQVPLQYPHILSVVGRKADPFIQQSRDNLEWYKLTNEIQMFMHSHEVNQKRLQEGLPVINSLWFWGGGEVSAPSGTNIRIYCDDFLVNAFLTRAGLMPQDPQEVIERNFCQHNIYLDLRLLRALKGEQGYDIHSIIENIESSIFQPLVSSVRSGGLKLRLRVGHEFDFELSRLSPIRFWSKPVNLITVAE